MTNFLIIVLLYISMIDSLVRSACDPCPDNQFNYNQCVDKKNQFCIDIVNPLKTTSKEFRITNEDRKNFKLITSENVFSEDLLKLEPVNSSIQVKSNNQNSSFVFTRKSGLIFKIHLYNISINPVYEDVTHSGDNNIILKSTQGSSTYHLKNPLINILNHHCRYPIPKYYYVTMNEYRHRFTTAVKIICANQKYPESKVFCPADYFDGQIYYFRTVNDRCSSNIASKLPFEKNSFYCTQNTEFVNYVFDYQIDEKISASQKSICDVYYKKCKTCIRNSIKSCKNPANKSKSCCEAKCYQTLSCMAFYTSNCYDTKFVSNAHAENICLKGDTLKFTLLPKFDFENESFLCHIKRKSDFTSKLGMSYSIQLPNNEQYLWTSKSIFNTLNLDQRQGRKTIDFISLSWKNYIDTEDEMYLRGFQRRNSRTMMYKLHKMKASKDFIRLPMKIFKHRDSKYLQFQNGQPFHFNSENWFNFSCRLNTRDFYPIQDVYLPNYQPVKLIDINRVSRSDPKTPFTYTMDSLDNPAQLNVQLLDQSIIPTFLCNGNSGRLILPADISDQIILKLTSVQWPRVWKIYFQGTVSDIPTFINIRIIDISSQSILFHQDQIIHKSYYDEKQVFVSENYYHRKSFQFTNEFQFDKKRFFSFHSKNFGFQFEISDCHKKYVYKLFHFSKIHTELPRVNRTDQNPIAEMGFINVANKITSITFLIGSVYFILILFYVLSSMWKKLSQRPDNWDKVKPKTKRPKSTYSNISCGRKVFMLFYVAFRVFYTFLFTLSVSLSLLLGIDSYSNELYGNQQKIFNWINHDSKQINHDSVTELKRQFQHSINMRKACENQDYLKIKKLDQDLLMALNNSLKHWYSINSKSIINQSVEFSESNIVKYEHRIDKISEKFQFNIRHRFFDRYGQYQQFLKQYYYLSYFNVVQKIHNESQQYSSNQVHWASVNQTFVQSSLIDFLNFLEIFEAKSLNFYPYQNLKTLRNQFLHFQSNQDKWKTRFTGKPFKYKRRPTTKSYHRMFDTKYIGQQFHNLILEQSDKLPNSRKINIKSLTTFKILNARIVMMFVDCFIVIYRFYNTFEILKWIFLGRRVYVFNSIPKDTESKKSMENLRRTKEDNSKFPNQQNYGFIPLTELSLKIISQNRFPDWSLINQNPSSYSSCFKSRKYFQSFGQMHFIAVTTIFLLIVALLTFVIVTNYWYIKHYNPDVYRENLEVLQKSQWLVNLISRKISNYINNYALTNSKIHNMNMSSLIINSSYLLSHNQKIVCQQLNWEIKSITSRSNTHSTLPFDICRLQSDVNFLPQLLMHISPCQFLGVLPINYTMSALLFDKSSTRSESINKINQIIFLIIFLIVCVATFIGSVQILGNIIIKSVLRSSENNRYFFLTSSYPHMSSVKIHSSSSHSNQSARNNLLADSNSILKRPFSTVTSGQFNDFSTSLHILQLTATSESDV